MQDLLTVTGVTKNYGGVLALDGVDFSVRAGEVHALMGENGAGKSTLSRIIAGVTGFDSGKIEFDGQVVRLNSPLEAQRLGIAIIFQELDLFPSLSVAENMVLGNLRFETGLLADRQKTLEFARTYINEVKLDLDGSELIEQLSIAQQQLVAIARALSMSARLILMDEPTSSLTQEAADQLFQLIAQLKSKGVAIVYVSHKMDEILRICDRMTVLRDGRLVGTRERAATDASELTRELIRMMVGRHIELSQRTRLTPSTKPLLRVELLTTQKLKKVSFTLHHGEVLGIAGLVGAGRSELGAAIFGLDPVLGGKIELRGKPLEIHSAAEAMRERIGLLPEDRKHEGLMMQMSVLENTTLSILPKVSRNGLLVRRAETKSVYGMKDRLRLKCTSVDDDVSLLSGGNQQKTLLARWLLLDPDVLFLDEPARGIDVGAKEDIYSVIEELSAQGKGIMLASSELPELLRCCHRILVLKDGYATALLNRETATQEAIMDAAAAGVGSGTEQRSR